MFSSRLEVHLDSKDTSYTSDGDTSTANNSLGLMATPKSHSTRPSFEQLPLHPHHPQGSAWGLWGDDDERGTLNLLTEDVVRNASLGVSRGRVISLKYEHCCFHDVGY